MKKDLLIMASVLAGSTAFAQLSITNANFSNVTDTAANETYDITGDITLGATNGGDDGDGTSAASEYILEGFTFVNPGATLTIEEGTIVRGQPFAGGATNPGSLVVSRGGAINAVGTSSDPIIFTTAQETDGTRWDGTGTFLDDDPAVTPLPPTTSASASPNVALWGAVTLLGYAPTNRGAEDTGTPGEAFIEGFGLSNEQVTYGGRLVNDSSGTLEYVSIRHSGRAISEGDEQQGLTCGGVGAGTKIENIDIYCSVDDGIEVFGGTVGFKNVMISYTNDDGFDLDQGWTGNAQFIFVLASNLANNDGLITMDKPGEWDGEDGAENQGTIETAPADGLSPTGQPFQNPTIYNMTIFAENSGGLIRCRNGFGGSVYNSLFYNAPNGGFRIDNTWDGSAEAFGYASTNPRSQSENGTLNFAGNIFLGEGSDAVASPGIANDAWAEAVMNNDTSLALNATQNTLGDNATDVGMGFNTSGNVNVQDIANGVNPVPVTGVGNTVPVSGSFFDDVDYQGAFPTSQTAALWTTGWTAMNIRGILVDNGNGDSL